MERNYYVINEETARRAHELMSMSDYVDGSKTAEYRSYVNKAYDLADQIAAAKPDRADRAYVLAGRYSKKMAEYFNRDATIGCMCPSVMISGAGNFPVKKKDKQIQAWDKNHQFFNEVQEILSQMKSILLGKELIKSGDEDAIERLEEKLEKLMEKQEFMKSVNAYYRKNGTVRGCPELTTAQVDVIEQNLKSDYCYEKKPFLTWELSNNNQNIHATQDRLERLKQAKQKGSQESECKYFRILENTECMRLQLIFEEKPSEEVRGVLKDNGFRWAPSVPAWQRQLTPNAKYALKKVILQLEQLEAAQ